ncbi:MAG TPA: metal-dependent hydrolase [Terriglobales bacterium]|nr:metal-dependent hydrolase [Terriglobales bacterium]
MEPITHLLTGGCLGRLGFNRKTALATATMVIAAEVPDVDIVLAFRDRVIAFAHHRGFTHTLLGVPFDAALALGLIFLYWRVWGHKRVIVREGDSPKPWQQPRWGLLYLFACIAALSHILLDFTNNYGVRPFSPFDPKWYSWDIVFIYEPLIWAALVIGLAAPALFRLINEEVGSRSRRMPGGRGGAIFACACIVALWTVRDFEHRRAVGDMQALLYKDEEPLRVRANPYPIDPFEWHGVVETKDFFALVPGNSSSQEVDPQGRMRIFYKPAETPVTLAAKKSYLGRVFLDWARFPMVEVEQHDDPIHTYTVRLYDLRYSYPDRTPRALGAVVELDHNLKVVDQYFESERSGKD